MKKLMAVLTALLPVIYAGSLYASFLLRADDDILFVILGGFAIIGFLFPVLFCIFTAKAGRKFLAVSNVWSYAGNILLFLSEIVLWFARFQEVLIAEQNGGMEGGLGLFLLILLFLPHWFSYLFTRIVGIVSCARSLKGVCSDGVRALHAVLQLLPGTDLISAVWVLRKVNYWLSFPRSPIEAR